MNCESGVLSADRDAARTDALDRHDVRAGAGEADDVHRLVLLAGGQAVDHVGSGQRLAVRPLRVLDDLERQRLVAVAPLPALREPRIDVASTSDRGNDERLVDRALHDVAVEGRARVRVERMRERRIARTRHDEALVCGGIRGGARRRPRGCTWHEARGHDRDCADDACNHQTARCTSWTSHSPTPFGSSPGTRPLLTIPPRQPASLHPRPDYGPRHSAHDSVTFTRSFHRGQELSFIVHSGFVRLSASLNDVI